MASRILVLRSGKGDSTRARAYAHARWPAARLSVYDIPSQGLPAPEFPWSTYDLVLIDDVYCRKEGLLWISSLRDRSSFPRLERVPSPKATWPVAVAATASGIRVEDSLKLLQLQEAQRQSESQALLKAAGISGFRPVKTLGKGATAVVCLCERESNDESVVLKVLRAEGSTDPELLPRFVQEFIAANRINDPRVARVLEHGFTESHAYIVMEYFPEGDLKSRLVRARPSEEEAVALIGAVLDALVVVHRAGIIHRDLKPANIMFREDGTLALTDFGSATQKDDPVLETAAGAIIGTPYYLSPEQAFGGAADPRSDLYSVGVLFYELLTNQRMHQAETVADLLEMHRTTPVPLLPKGLRRHQHFLDKLVAKRPIDRYQTAAAALDGLMSYMLDDGGAQVA